MTIGLPLQRLAASVQGREGVFAPFASLLR